MTMARNAGSLYRRVSSPARLAAAAGVGSAFEQLEARSLFAVDAVTTNHPLWVAIDGAATIDGVINQSEWANAATIVRTQPHLDQSNITLRIMYSDTGLLIAADVRDTRLWADGSGGGTGNRWEFWKDDGLALFFDPRNTRAKALPSSGRMLAYNIGSFNGPTSGTGRVSRYDFLRGDGAGSGALVTPDGLLTPGLQWATRVKGTVNRNNNKDVGWTSEVIIPWEALGMSGRPINGQTIGMNFDAYFDNNGNDRTSDYFGTSTDPATRTGDRIVDDHINAVYSSLNYSDSGWRGPVNYAVLQFVDRSSADQPRAITNLTASSVSGYGARLDFTAPTATLAGKGNVSAYQIRWSTTPIVIEEDWQNAQATQNNFVPHLRGKRESLRIGLLSPDTQHFFAVRAADFAGRLGDIASVTFTTQTELQDPSGGQRLMVSPVGNTLVTEAGDPFIMVGGTVGISSLYVRGLYDGGIWNSSTEEFINFSERTNNEGTPEGYFDALASYGVNTLRVQLERTQLEDTPAARAELPNGMPWLEWREPGDTGSTFNDNMKDYLHALMAQAARTGIRFMLQTFNNFNYGNYFDLTPYSTVNGGPVSSMDEFYQSAEVLEMAKQRMSVLADWVRESPHAYTMMGFELVNEWDGGRADADEVTEMRQRSRFLIKLATHLRSYAPELNVMSTTIGLSLRGPVARAVFYSDAFDILDPHFYTPSTAEPVNNPQDDKSVRPGMDYGALAAYWLTSRRDNRPVHNAEWDLVGRNWSDQTPYYTDYSQNADPDRPFYLAEDEAIYRVTSWVSIASGLAGSGLRIGGSELRDTYPETFDPDTTGYLPVPLSIGMRQTQQSVTSFVNGNQDALFFDWANYRTTTLSGRLSFNNTGGHTLRAWGSTDGDQGLAYVLRDSGKSSGEVGSANLKIEGLDAGSTYTFEFWSTGADTQVISTLEGLVAGTRFTTVALPSFGTDVMIKFRKVA